MYELPTSITIQGQSWAIRNRGDYRVILDCFLVLEDTELTEQERVIAALIIFLEDLNDFADIPKLGDNLEEAYNQMVNFFNCGQDESNTPSHGKLIDWDKDSMLIVSAINKVAGKEIRAEEYIHWWTFMAYYVAIGQCSLSTVVGIRYKRAKGKKLEKYEKEFVQNNPQYFMTRSVEQIEAEEWVRQQWEGG